MILHAFYNKDNVGDILLVRLGNGIFDSFKKDDDLVTLYDDKSNIIGYNILNASSKFDALSNGLVEINENFFNQLNNCLQDKIDINEIDFEKKFIVGKVISIEEHPDSDHMHICQVDLKDKVTQIVCGASNIDKDQLVVVATIGAVMPSGLIIKPSKLRGIESNGMICSARELNLKDAPQKKGILVLDDSYKIGDSFF